MRLWHRWAAVVAIACFAAALFLAPSALAATGGVIVSNQNDCTVGPTNDNFLAPGQTAYVWLIFNKPTSVRGYSYEITGTSKSSYDSGILKINFTQCKTGSVDDWVAKFTTPTTPGGYTLTVFNAAGKKVSSDNFTVT
jgi:hypothetical protein